MQITDLLAYALLTQTVFNSTVASINGSFWTIALEFQLYLVFPILLWVYKKKGLFGIITLRIATTLLWELFYMWYSSQPASSVVMGNRDLHFPARWIEFIFGMVAALFVSHPSPRQTKLSLLILVLVFPVSIIAVPLKLSVASLAILWGITFGALIVSCAELPESLFGKHKPLGLLTGIGTVSYSLYLLHQPLLLLAASYINSLGLSTLSTFGLFTVAGVPILVLIATVFFLLFERPFLYRKKSKADAGNKDNIASVIQDQAIP